MATPEWISKELFECALKNYFENNEIEIITFTSTDAVDKGENYVSDLFRSTLHFIRGKSGKKESISVIVKCCTETDDTRKDIVKNLHLSEKEVEMFTKTFPAVYDILGEQYTLSAKYFYTEVEPHFVIVLEDLTTLGFQMLPRHLSFDLEHCFKVIEKLAQMHAASVIMYDKDPSLVKHYNEGLFADNEMIRNWLKVGYKALALACQKWPGLEKYGYKLDALGEEAIVRGLKATKRRLGGFNVLNHGDLWVNNMMFSYNLDGKLKDMRFLDFQMNVFTSPAIDLHYFLVTSTKIQVKMDHIDIILDHYYAQLISNLAKHQYSLERVPSREQLKKDYNSRAFYGIMGAATVLPLVMASPRKDAAFENIMKDDSIDGFRYHAYNNERYRKHMEFILPYYDNFGILD